mmetsp:Transcript_5702/g.22084  ORF Transcript_5702/g.22084 Transcript_5702/m.22084 type:complete len:201 (+) Transcript_5702:242-844(+)
MPLVQPPSATVQTRSLVANCCDEACSCAMDATVKVRVQVLLFFPCSVTFEKRLTPFSSIATTPSEGVSTSQPTPDESNLVANSASSRNCPVTCDRKPSFIPTANAAVGVFSAIVEGHDVPSAYATTVGGVAYPWEFSYPSLAAGASVMVQFVHALTTVSKGLVTRSKPMVLPPQAAMLLEKQDLNNNPVADGWRVKIAPP